MSRVTFEAGRWPLVAELPPPPPPQGVRRRRLRDDGWRSRDSVWDLLPGSLTGRTRNGSNPLADSIRSGPTLTWTKDSIWAAQPIKVAPRRAHNHRSCKFSLPGFKPPMPSLCFAGILHRRAASPNSVPPLLHLVWTRLVNLFVCWDEHPPLDGSKLAARWSIQPRPGLRRSALWSRVFSDRVDLMGKYVSVPAIKVSNISGVDPHRNYSLSPRNHRHWLRYLCRLTSTQMHSFHCRRSTRRCSRSFGLPAAVTEGEDNHNSRTHHEEDSREMENGRVSCR
ncbi:hypothetical protein BHM03_00036836 [Ensete ventricosum]|nr:hypothetical protein BHM03_00036836 [Ensete ventricosum]